MVLCADCGNNCCTGGTGTIDINGQQCGCVEAYVHQYAYWKNPKSVKFVKDNRKELGKPMPTPEEA